VPGCHHTPNSRKGGGREGREGKEVRKEGRREGGRGFEHPGLSTQQTTNGAMTHP